MTSIVTRSAQKKRKVMTPTPQRPPRVLRTVSDCKKLPSGVMTPPHPISGIVPPPITASEIQQRMKLLFPEIVVDQVVRVEWTFLRVTHLLVKVLSLSHTRDLLLYCFLLFSRNEYDTHIHSHVCRHASLPLILWQPNPLTVNCHKSRLLHIARRHVRQAAGLQYPLLSYNS